MARPRGDDVKRQVALATFELIAEEGIDGLTMRRLADVTGLSTGTINHHYGSKRGVLLASIEYGYRQRPAPWDEDDPAANLRSLLRRYELSSPARRSWWKFWLATASYAQRDEEVSRVYRDQHDWMYDRVSVLLREGTAGGVFTVDAPIEEAASQLVALAHGHAVAQLVMGAEPAEAARVFDDVVAGMRRRKRRASSA